MTCFQAVVFYVFVMKLVKLVMKNECLFFVLYSIYLHLLKKFLVRLIIYIFALIFCVQEVISQSHIYKHFDVDDGLPSSEIYDVYQDKQGYVWFATDKGISRYNGYEFENFTTLDGLPGNTILDFYPQKNGQVWCYAYNTKSLFYFDDVFKGFKQYKYNSVLRRNISGNSVVKSIYVADDGAVKVAGYTIVGYIEITSKGDAIKHFNKITVKNGEGVNVVTRFDEDFFFLIYHDYKNEELEKIGLKYKTKSRIDVRYLDDKNIILIDGRLGVVSQKNKVIYHGNQKVPIGIKPISSSTFFVGYYGKGAEIRNVDGDVIETFLPEKSVSNFLVDAEGGYWFTTLNDGVFYIRKPKMKVFTRKTIKSLVKDHRNKLYVGFQTGDIATVEKSNFKTLYKSSNKDKALVEFDRFGKKVYGYSDGCIVDYPLRQQSFNLFASKLPERIGNPLLSVTKNVYTKVKEGVFTKSYLSDVRMQDVCVFNDTIFLGTSSGLFFQKENTLVKHQFNNLLRLRIDDVDVSNNKKSMYMATQGNGVVVYGDSIYNIAKKNGLTNNIISEIYVENDSTIWACSNSGLNRIVFTSNNGYDISKLTKSDGLISNDINDVEIVNDTVWVATKKGLSFFNKNILDQDLSSKVLSFRLKEVLVNNIIVDNSLDGLKHNQNDIGFRLRAVSIKNSGRIKYQYRLKEMDTVWKFTKNRLINFLSLPPGRYTFQAKVDVLNHPEQSLINYKFTILPPFWNTWWFYTLCFLIFVGFVYLFFRVRVLTYNKDVFRELIRLVIKRLKRKERFYKFRSNGEDYKISTSDIQYVNSQGNYLDVITKCKKFTIRCKISDFIKGTPDPLEYLRIHRSYIVRIDQVSGKGKKWVIVNGEKIPVAETYLKELDKIQF